MALTEDLQIVKLNVILLSAAFSPLADTKTSCSFMIEN